MTTNPAQDPVPHQNAASESSYFKALVLGCIGVVYGDIGTSPLYAYREAALRAIEGGSSGRDALFGVLSLIVWALIAIVTLKYVFILLRADNKGEGGILSLMALAQKATGRKFGLVFVMGVAGAALFYGDAAITPAISVLSAVEGLGIAIPSLQHMVLPIAMLILGIFFFGQRHGTEKVSVFFGPVMLVWFLVLAVSGIVQIVKEPGVLMALGPHYGLFFLYNHSGIAMAVLGSVFLAVTGAEALYADLGHFGRKPIQSAWFYIVFPALILNYMGQAALVVSQPETIQNPFYLMTPGWALLPMVGLATFATIIASQAVVTGAFSITRQAIQLGLLPRLRIVHTSALHEGQIYMPKINRFLFILVLLLCCVFKSSSALASAYGIAVTGTMIVTTCLAYVYIRSFWRKNRGVALGIVLPFVFIEGVFLVANMQKIADGGYVPLMIAGALILMIWTWVKGTNYLYEHDHHKTVPLTDLTEMLDRDMPARVPGTAIFLTSDPLKTPIALIQNLRHNKIFHAHNIILTVVTTHTPKVSDEQRMIIEPITSSITRVILIFGYMETPDVPRALRLATLNGLNHDINMKEASFFLGKRSIVTSSEHRLQQRLVKAWNEEALPCAQNGLFRKKPKTGLSHMGLPQWQDRVYISMAHASVAATDFFRIPRAQVVELGTQLSI